MIRTLTVCLFCLLVATLPSVAQASADSVIWRASIPAEPPHQGEVRLIRRDSALVMQTILNAMAFDMNIAEAAAAPRVHHQWMPDRVLIEPGISRDTLDILEGMGHNIESTRRTLGRTNSIQLDGPWRYGYSDLRRPGGHVAK